eukprot:6205891-Pleurochrysis_carterae.AAC.7
MSRTSGRCRTSSMLTSAPTPTPSAFRKRSTSRTWCPSTCRTASNYPSTKRVRAPQSRCPNSSSSRFSPSRTGPQLTPGSCLLIKIWSAHCSTARLTRGPTSRTKYAVGMLCRAMNCPTDELMAAAQRVLVYTCPTTGPSACVSRARLAR